VRAVGAIICLAFVCSMFFLSVDRRALEWSRALRKHWSAPNAETAPMAPVRIMAAE
jgi:hypothetical protein